LALTVCGPAGQDIGSNLDRLQEFIYPPAASRALDCQEESRQEKEGKKYTHLVANPQQNPLQIHWAKAKRALL
jgi:hypothetical protein